MVRLNPRSFRVLNQDGASDMMHSVEGADHVGALLREAREASGRSVADVVASLRIRRVYLEAIEDGRFDELPGAAYAVGFVRSYATYLRLDAPALLVERQSDKNDRGKVEQCRWRGRALHIGLDDVPGQHGQPDARSYGHSGSDKDNVPPRW